MLGIKAEELNDDFFDYVFLHQDKKDLTIDIAKLNQLRKEFEYWYPMDLRVSGQDLIKNHLTMSLYNHAAIWKDDPSKWPRGYYCNGFILVIKAISLRLIMRKCQSQRETF